MRYYLHVPTSGVPPLGSVLTPHMNRTASGWASSGRVHGAPGTQRIPIPDPAGIHEDVNSLASVGQFSSAHAPNEIYPALYWEADRPEDKEHFPGALMSDDQMPMPALRPGHKYPADPYKARHGGQAQVVQPQVVQTFPKWMGPNIKPVTTVPITRPSTVYRPGVVR